MMDGNGNCKACPGKCNWREHKNVPYVIHYDQKTKQVTAEEVKRAFEEATNQKATTEALLQARVDAYNSQQQHLMDMIEHMRWSKQRLLEIALRPCVLENTDHLDLMIEAEKSEAKPLWSQRVKQLQHIKERLMHGNQVMAGQSPVDKILQKYKQDQKLQKYLSALKSPEFKRDLTKPLQHSTRSSSNRYSTGGTHRTTNRQTNHMVRNGQPHAVARQQPVGVVEGILSWGRSLIPGGNHPSYHDDRGNHPSYHDDHGVILHL